MVSRNYWKLACFLLLGLIAIYGVRSFYWHQRWVDAELYYLRQDEAQIIRWIQLQQPKKP